MKFIIIHIERKKNKRRRWKWWKRWWRRLYILHQSSIYNISTNNTTQKKTRAQWSCCYIQKKKIFVYIYIKERKIIFLQSFILRFFSLSYFLFLDLSLMIWFFSIYSMLCFHLRFQFHFSSSFYNNCTRAVCVFVYIKSSKNRNSMFKYNMMFTQKALPVSLFLRP